MNFIKIKFEAYDHKKTIYINLPDSSVVFKSLKSNLKKTSIFASIVNDNTIEIKNIFNDQRIVEDEERFFIVNGKMTRNRPKDKIIKNVLLLLESPHKDEFDQNFKPIRPANGTTGRNIESSFIGKIFEKVQDSFKREITYSITICNPIQFQTSLFVCHGQPLKNEYALLRNIVWMKLWELKCVKKRFCEKIKGYDLIINSCTEPCKYLVQQLLIEKNKLPITINTSHPSSGNWIRKNVSIIQECKW